MIGLLLGKVLLLISLSLSFSISLSVSIRKCRRIEGSTLYSIYLFLYFALSYFTIFRSFFLATRGRNAAAASGEGRADGTAAALLANGDVVPAPGGEAETVGCVALPAILLLLLLLLLFVLFAGDGGLLPLLLRFALPLLLRGLFVVLLRAIVEGRGAEVDRCTGAAGRATPAPGPVAVVVVVEAGRKGEVEEGTPRAGRGAEDERGDPAGGVGRGDRRVTAAAAGEVPDEEGVVGTERGTAPTGVMDREGPAEEEEEGDLPLPSAGRTLEADDPAPGWSEVVGGVEGTPPPPPAVPRRRASIRASFSRCRVASRSRASSVAKLNRPNR